MRKHCATDISRVRASDQLAESISRAVDAALAPVGLTVADLDGRCQVSDPYGWTLGAIIKSLCDQIVEDPADDVSLYNPSDDYPFDPEADLDHEEVPF